MFVRWRIASKDMSRPCPILRHVLRYGPRYTGLIAEQFLSAKMELSKPNPVHGTVESCRRKTALRLTTGSRKLTRGPTVAVAGRAAETIVESLRGLRARNG